MAYNIQKTDNTTLVTVNDTELNNDFGISLVGRNYSGYGVYLNDNFVRLMENFAKATPPLRPLAGQLWFDSVSKTINLYNGAGYKTLAPLSVGSTEPAAGPRAVGDLWWDLENLQLKAYTSSTFAHTATMAVGNVTEIKVDNTTDLQIGDYVTSSGGNITLATASRVENILSTTNLIITNPATIASGETVTFYRGTGWNVVGPAYSIKQGVSGTVGKTLVDTNGLSHVVAITYVKDQPVAVYSKDQEFTPRNSDRVVGWSTIKPGLSLRGSGVTQVQRTVTAYASGSLLSTVVPVSSLTDVGVGDYIISSNVSLGSGVRVTNLFVANSSILVDTNTIFGQDELIAFQRGTDIAFLLQGTSTNSQALDGVSPDRYARKDRDESFAGDVSVHDNLYVGNRNLNVMAVGNGNVEINTDTLGGNIVFSGNVVGSGTVDVLTIDNLQGEVSVRANPVTDLGVVPKQYSDAQLVQASDWLAANVATLIGPTTPADRNSFSEVSALANTIISTADALAADVALKAYIDSPSFTGIPTAPTAASSDNSGQVATTEYVSTAVNTLAASIATKDAQQDVEINLRAPLDSPVLTGAPRAETPLDTDQTTRIATTRFTSNLISILRTDTTNALSLKAPLDSPAFTGTPTATTATLGDSSTRVATTQFVSSAVQSLKDYTDANAAAQTNQLNTKAPLQSPTFSGVPNSVTPPTGDNTTRIATTEFVTGGINNLNTQLRGAINLKLDTVSGAMTGIPTAPNAVVGTNTAQIATTAFVQEAFGLKANISGVAFTGNVTLPTPLITDNSTQASTTNWVRNYVNNYASARYWQGSSKFVSTNTPDPNQGTDGDFWFQYTP
jgi:hypothetical protein